MTTVTLFAKTTGASQTKHAENHLQSLLEGLKVDAKIVGAADCGWIQVALSGEDEKIALNFLTREVGLCPERLENVKRFSTVTGRITALTHCEDRLAVDVGVFSPDVIHATVPLQSLQAQLVDGRKVALRNIVELFGFSGSLPLSVKILGVDYEERRIEAVLADKQLAKYGEWMRSLLDRLTVLGASRENVESALERAESKRDVVAVESLGLFEQAIVCKLGTDAAGLIPRIGRALSYATFSVFSPRRILEFVGDYSFPLISY
jgi:hypothetical protein